MWLRDALPQDVPYTRVITYGYDTSLCGSKSVQGIDDLARSMVKKLEAIRQLGPHRKPIVFLAHSLGGIVLKRALTFMARSGGC
jgi:alpha-beta hydrolase superfamily lysophospholipase